MAESPEFSHLIVVGASAGGIDALSTLLAELPEDFPAPLVIAQHIDPTPSRRRSRRPCRRVSRRGATPRPSSSLNGA